MANIVKRVVDLQGEGGLKASNLLLAFIGARVLPLQRWSHKMCFLGSNRDPTQNSSKVLSAEEVVRKANKITEVKLTPEWKWGLRPHDRNNQIAAVNSPDFVPFFSQLEDIGWLDDFLTGFTCRVCSLCKLQRTWRCAKIVSKMTGRSRMMGSSRMMMMTTTALASPLRAPAPSLTKTGARSWKGRVKPLVIRVSPFVLPI
jgi:hypothetical protein